MPRAPRCSGRRAHYRYDANYPPRSRPSACACNRRQRDNCSESIRWRWSTAFVRSTCPKACWIACCTPGWNAMAPAVPTAGSRIWQGTRTPTIRGTRGFSRLRLKRGTVAIQELAESAGLSLRHFQRRFRNLTGLNPKLYARICRIGHAVHRKGWSPMPRGRPRRWKRLCRPAHFIRDFKELTGISPGHFLRGQSPIMRYPRTASSGHQPAPTAPSARQVKVSRGTPGANPSPACSATAIESGTPAARRSAGYPRPHR